MLFFALTSVLKKCSLPQHNVTDLVVYLEWFCLHIRNYFGSFGIYMDRSHRRQHVRVASKFVLVQLNRALAHSFMWARAQHGSDHIPQTNWALGVNVFRRSVDHLVLVLFFLHPRFNFKIFVLFHRFIMFALINNTLSATGENTFPNLVGS